MRIVFMGTPDFAVPALDALVEAGHEIVAVYCQPPRPAGRGKALQPSPVQRRAEALGLVVRHPVSLRDADEQARFAALGADAAVVAAYGLILPRPILATPRLGCFNIHASLLPRWRGAAPIQRAIIAGDKVTGITIMRMEAGLDTGPVLTSAAIRLFEWYTTGRLADVMADLGAQLIVEFLRAPQDYPEQAQPEKGVTYAHKVEKSETRINFEQPADLVARQIHAFAPSPGAWFEYNGLRYRVLSALTRNPLQGPETYFSTPPGTVVNHHSFEIKCGVGSLQIIELQRAGGKAMRLHEFVKGNSLPPVGASLT